MALRGGMDLGTTYSAVSYYDPNDSRVETIDLDTADGAKVIRSVVFYPGSGEAPVVGDTAWNAARQEPDRVILGIKRSMGSDYLTPLIDGVRYSPPQVSAEILRTLAHDAAMFLGEPLTDVVITVPAYFGDGERAATEEAGRLAGLNVLGLLPEPHAAALAYAVDRVAEIQDRYLLVYDLGGGTFDVTLIHAGTTGGASGIALQIETLCKAGNAQLGGLDWDRALADIVAEKVMDAHGVDPRQDAKNEAVLFDNCEKAKRDLSRHRSAMIVANLERHQVEVSVTEFEDRTRDLLAQSEALVEQVMADAESQHGISRDQIEVMLTGGSTRMPMVRRMIQGITGKPPLQHGNPELLVTRGAAYWAHLLQADAPVIVNIPGPQGPVPTPVTLSGLTDTGRAIGVEVFRPDGQGGMTRFNSVVVPEGAAYGEQFEKDFATTEDGMTEIPIILYEGASDSLDDCIPLMTFTLTGLPPGRPRGQRVSVKLGYDQSGILRGQAVAGTGQNIEIVVDRIKNRAS